MSGCGICGGKMVIIRGSNPHIGKREVCPTCLAERMDNIRKFADKDYGRAYQQSPSDPTPLE